MLGPIWNQSLFDESFINKAMEHLEENTALFRTHKKVNGYLSVLSQVCGQQYPFMVRKIALSSLIF